MFDKVLQKNIQDFVEESRIDFPELDFEISAKMIQGNLVWLLEVKNNKGIEVYRRKDENLTELLSQARTFLEEIKKENVLAIKWWRNPINDEIISNSEKRINPDRFFNYSIPMTDVDEISDQYNELVMIHNFIKDGKNKTKAIAWYAIMDSEVTADVDYVESTPEKLWIPLEPKLKGIIAGFGHFENRIFGEDGSGFFNFEPPRVMKPSFMKGFVGNVGSLEQLGQEIAKMFSEYRGQSGKSEGQRGKADDEQGKG